MVVQKPLREGFGFTVIEVMWKAATVVSGNVGVIWRQIVDGESGFLVSSVEEMALESVRKNYLLTRLLEQYPRSVRLLRDQVPAGKEVTMTRLS